MNEENHSVEEELIVKHLTGEATAAEEKTLQEWITLSKENEALFNKMRKVFELTGKYYKPGASSELDIDVSKEWDQFKKSIEDEENLISIVPAKSSPQTWLRVAAVILLVVVSGIVINYFAAQGEQVYQTAENSETIELPDGSTVNLNRNSRITFRKKFGVQHREITLEGEGFFDVVPSKERPFIIRMQEAEITVLGTAFNVHAYATNKEVTVTVASGVVRLAPKQLQQMVELKAGEKGVFDKLQKALTSKQNDDINYLAWKTRKIVFEESNLNQVAEALRSAYGVDVTISADVSAACRVTVTFDNQTLDAVLKVLKSTLDLTYKINGNQIEITKAGC